MSTVPSVSFREMTLADHRAVIDLMQRTPGVSIRDADSPEAIARFLNRNPGLSFIAESEGYLVGCLMSGHDGRRGSLYHLAVDAAWRRQGIASVLVDRCLAELARQGIHKTHIDVFRSNEDGNAFWSRAGWVRRDDLHRFSIIRGGGENA